MASSNELISKLFEVANKFNTAIFVTHDQSGNLHGRPMRILKATNEEGFWLITSIDSPKVFCEFVCQSNYEGVGIEQGQQSWLVHARLYQMGFCEWKRYYYPRQI